MHKSDIKAMIEKKGLTLSGIDKQNDFAIGTCRDALRRKRPSAESAICEVLDLPPSVVFPDRYLPSGERLDRRSYPKGGKPQ